MLPLTPSLVNTTPAGQAGVHGDHLPGQNGAHRDLLRMNAFTSQPSWQNEAKASEGWH